MKTVLIIGGTGFIGYEITKTFVHFGYQTDILSRGTKKIKSNVVNNHIICNRRQRTEVEQRLKNTQYDYIIDMCAYNKSDIVNVVNGIDRSRLKKYVLYSTGAVCNSINMPITDKTPLDNNLANSYILGKIETENALKKAEIPYLILRPTIVYGANNSLPREQKVLKAIKFGKLIYVRNLKNVMNLIHVKDLAEITYKLTIDSLINQEFFIYNPEIITHKYFLECCEIIMNKKAETTLIRKHADLIFPFLPVDIIFESDKFELIIGNHQFTTLQNGIRSCL